MIPDYQTLMRPTLVLLEDGNVRSMRQLREQLADEFDLTEDEREEKLPSGTQSMIANRVGWALTYLAQSDLVHRPSRGHYQITARGSEALRLYADKIDLGVLENYPEYLAFKERGRSSQGVRPDSRADGGDPHEDRPATETGEESSTPEERFEYAAASMRTVVEAEVLDAAKALDPYSFEKLVIKLLAAMGYGNLGSLERAPDSGDGGVDGIISQDPLGLERFYVQAKCYKTDHSVTRPEVQAFAGALEYKHSDRGVFITTSRFTSGAKESIERFQKRIELIDGEGLAKLLVDYRVGVQVKNQVTVYELDRDFFEDVD